MPQATSKQGQPAPRETINQLAALVRDEGEATIARRLRLSRQTLARAMAGLPLREGTLALLREALPVAMTRSVKEVGQ